MSWYLAPSLRNLFAEINQTAPGRDKAGDGTIGDLSHQARRSDHNPDRGAGGVVRAIDVTHDPAHGCDCNRLTATIRSRRDPRVAYVIWSGRIMSGAAGLSPWRWRRYKGRNPHNHHMHVSIRHTTDAEADLRSWMGGAAVAGAKGPVDPVPSKPALPGAGLGRGASGEVVRWLQRRLNAIAGRNGHSDLDGRPLTPDGIFGRNTEAVVRTFQAHRGLPASGRVDQATWQRL